MRIKEITISGFRGFKNEYTLKLNKKVILIKGLNGTGKSSLVEALEWLFFDEISRKKKSLCKSEYVGEFLRNIHCEKTQETFVKVLVDIDGEEIELTKKLLSPKKNEYYINGSLVKDFSQLGISFAEVYKPILSQVEIKHYVETDPKDRWEETNKILGLGVFSEFRTTLQELLTSKRGESRYETPKKILYGLESELKEFTELQGLLMAMEHRPFSTRAFKKELIKTITTTYALESKSIDGLSENIDKQVVKLVKRDKNFETIQVLIIPNQAIVTYPSKLVESLKQIFNSLKELRIVNVDLHKFLEIGKRLIDNSTCPFCLEKTLTGEKLKLIGERMKETEDAMKLLSDIETRLAKFFQLKEEMIQKLTFFPSVSTLEKIKERISQSPEYATEVKKIDGIMKQVRSFNEIVEMFNAELECLVEKAKLTSEGRAKFDESKLESEIAKLEKDGKTTEHVLSEMRDGLQSLLTALVSKMPSLSDKEKIELKKVLLFRRIIDHLDDVKYVGIYENNLNQVSDLINEIEKFEKVKSGALLSGLNKQIKDFYSKLNPNEKIKFSEIVPTKGKRRRIQIKATSYGKNMNPVSCFSESHMNCLCLSIYFSQRVLNNPYWKFVMLDDPIQSMDDDHAKNLIRILTEIAKDKQVIVLSHNAKFCQDFRDLFYGTDYLFYEFSGYSKNGPRIDLKQAPFDTYVAIARAYCDGNMEERAIAGNNLRKAIERFTLDVLVHRGKRGYGKASSWKLDERLEKMEASKLLALEEIGEIKAVLNVCDACSHEPPRREVTPKELLDGIDAMENLCSKYLK